ncbi:TPA: hypothetical protein H1005_02020 [archaeon]|uniref:Uncharacterized protein n=1 Tax=Candidatus Naiadarchaeum limnaeum TaxID=2756139 RepID=A0A832XJN8_9ARCH|nr:hypothetical protein [Candidatus Naiadarchaeales archaeon SRR2090153.bin1042]HIK00862.1 hypothetical protein [Candidatus Naiadarchaeum limnaeum]
MGFLTNVRGHANPISIALNIVTVILGLTIIFFNPTFLPIKGIVFFAAYLLIVQMIHVMAFGANPVGMILSTVVIIGSAIVLKLGIAPGPNYVTENANFLIIVLLGLYLMKEVTD